MWKAFKIFWKSNPWFQVTLGFMLMFTTLVAIAGGHPVMTAIITVTFIALFAGTIYNVLQIKKRNDREQS